MEGRGAAVGGRRARRGLPCHRRALTHPRPAPRRHRRHRSSTATLGGRYAAQHGQPADVDAVPFASAGRRHGAGRPPLPHPATGDAPRGRRWPTARSSVPPTSSSIDMVPPDEAAVGDERPRPLAESPLQRTSDPPRERRAGASEAGAGRPRAVSLVGGSDRRGQASIATASSSRRPGDAPCSASTCWCHRPTCSQSAP